MRPYLKCAFFWASFLHVPVSQHFLQAKRMHQSDDIMSPRCKEVHLPRSELQSMANVPLLRVGIPFDQSYPTCPPSDRIQSFSSTILPYTRYERLHLCISASPFHSWTSDHIHYIHEATHLVWDIHPFHNHDRSPNSFVCHISCRPNYSMYEYRSFVFRKWTTSCSRWFSCGFESLEWWWKEIYSTSMRSHKALRCYQAWSGW